LAYLLLDDCLYKLPSFISRSPPWNTSRLSPERDVSRNSNAQVSNAAYALPCRECGAKLHWGSYGRKPRAVPAGLGPEHLRRFSLCCAKDGCRTRDTPSSVRFLSRKVLLGAMVVLISAMQSGLNPARMKRLKALVGVSRRTVMRWRDWWCAITPRETCER
jgi:hypothetical protein